MKFNSPHSLLIFRGSLIVALVSTTILSLIDLRELPPINIWDKLEHASAFLILSFLLDQSLPQFHTRRMLHPGQMLFLLAYGVLIEYLQSFTTYREASFNDVVADITGISSYWLIYFFRCTGNNRSRHG